MISGKTEWLNLWTILPRQQPATWVLSEWPLARARASTILRTRTGKHADYHWINVGMSPDITSRNNPWTLLLNNYNEDDLIIVKLDVNTPSVEVLLAFQLLNNPWFHKLVDHFYFEHHAHMCQIACKWGVAQGSMKDLLDPFQALHYIVIPAHFLV